MSQPDADDRQFEPTAQKLREARSQGDVPRSADLPIAAILGALAMTMAGLGPWMVDRFATAAGALLSGRAVSPGLAVVDAGLAFAPVILVTLLAAILAQWGQNALILAPERISPKWSRIDPVANLRQRFGLDALTDLLRNLVKLVVFSLLLGGFLWWRLDEAMVVQGAEPGPVTVLLAILLRDFLFLAAGIHLVTGGADYLWQRFSHLRRNRMSRQELVDEMRQSEGDPHVRQARRAMAQAIAQNRMMADVPKADVVIVNPTHYAVALKWSRGSRRAPVCLAKGVDHVAARIREAAATAGVPIRSDPPVARALYASIELGQEIRPEHYAAVAAAIRFADAMRRRSRGLA